MTCGATQLTHPHFEKKSQRQLGISTMDLGLPRSLHVATKGKERDEYPKDRERHGLRAFRGQTPRDCAIYPNLGSPRGRWRVTARPPRFIVSRHPKLPDLRDAATCKANIQIEKRPPHLRNHGFSAIEFYTQELHLPYPSKLPKFKATLSPHRIESPMAPKAAFELPPIFILQFTDTHFGKKLLAMSKQQWIHMQLAQVEKIGTTTPKQPEVTTFQTKENLLSLTKKRKRGAKSTGMDDRELMVDHVSIISLVKFLVLGVFFYESRNRDCHCLLRLSNKEGLSKASLRFI
eukprot:Gb_06801 [translate_table: standard]